MIRRGVILALALACATIATADDWRHGLESRFKAFDARLVIAEAGPKQSLTTDYITGANLYPTYEAPAGWGLEQLGQAPDWVTSAGGPTLMASSYALTWADPTVSNATFNGLRIDGSLNGAGNSTTGYANMFGAQISVNNNTTGANGSKVSQYGIQVSANSLGSATTGSTVAIFANASVGAGGTAPIVHAGEFTAQPFQTSTYSEAAGVWIGTDWVCDTQTYFPACADASKIYGVLSLGMGRNLFDSNANTRNYSLETARGKGALLSGTVGQLQLAKEAGGSKPTCDSAHRGSIWYEPGAADVADSLEVCRKDGSNVYAWVALY